MSWKSKVGSSLCLHLVSENPAKYCSVTLERFALDTHLVVGKPGEMECKVSGSAPLTTSWFHNGVKKRSLKEPASGSLQKLNLTTHLFYLNPEPPSFMEPVTVSEGEKLSLKCHVNGSPPLNIQWMKDRRELKSSGNTRITFVGGTASLEVSPVSKTDAGDYLCKASNATGSDFCKSRVTVQGNDLMWQLYTHLYETFADTGAKTAPTEATAPTAAAPVKRLDNLFFIEEPKNVSVMESKETSGHFLRQHSKIPRDAHVCSFVLQRTPRPSLLRSEATRSRV
uniref:Ig-like domain-containing protein n=1 Tax=Acanthochromis polyacanthus TaxID=80966 RepID=A0A3Q1F5P8_9TELE